MTTNKIEYKPYSSSLKLEKKFNIFFERTFNSFHEELQLLRNTMYKSEQSKDIFALNERTWVGILNNAILKAFPNDEVSTLQEFGVYHNENKNHIGRADYLVCWEDKYLLFEAKQYEELSTKKLIQKVNDKSYDKEFEQAMNYYKAESIYYKGKTVYIIPIYFGWMREKIKYNLIDEAKKYKIESDDETDFCALYYEGNNGVWVYGKVYNIGEVITN
ncbi:MAG: hypothetical protein WCK82_04520 [Bacteroidota bacterium]|jgi:hypothetical protein